MKSLWKGLTYVTPGVLPLGGGHVWAQQRTPVWVQRCVNQGTSKIPAYVAWVSQSWRSYYQCAPWTSFIRQRPKGNPARLKWRATVTTRKKKRSK